MNFVFLEKFCFNEPGAICNTNHKRYKLVRCRNFVAKVLLIVFDNSNIEVRAVSKSKDSERRKENFRFSNLTRKFTNFVCWVLFADSFGLIVAELLVIEGKVLVDIGFEEV